VKVKVLALDLEGTLISNAVSQIARPGLYDFLEDCRELFPRIVIFTSVNEERFRTIANLLTTEGYAPNWFADIEYITWTGETKNLNFVDRDKKGNGSKPPISTIHTQMMTWASERFRNSYT
jgi:hypothetical protein